MNHGRRGLSEQKNSNRNNGFRMNNQNNFNIYNITPINLNNMSPNIIMVNSQNNFNNMGGSSAINFPMNNNMNQLHNFNQFNNRKIANERYNMNNNMNNNNMNINMNNCFMKNKFMNNNFYNSMNNNMNNCMNNNMNNGMNNNMNNGMNNNMNNCMNNNMNNGMNNIMNNCMNNRFTPQKNINFVQPNIKPIWNAQNDNNFAFPFRKSISNEIKETPNISNLFNNNNQIKMRFSFQTGQNFDVFGKPYERLMDVINRFENGCPDALKKYLKNCLCNGKPADRNKTLSELEIKNGHNILFVENKNAKKEYKLTQKEEESYSKYRGEFYALKILNNYENNESKLNSDELKNYSSFYNSKDKSYSVSVNEHTHLLVYCLTNLDWKCNLCLINYEKSNGRYYCSKCDFNICENCHYKKNYVIKKSFPKNTCPSNTSVESNYLNTDLHEHPLIYCRSSKKLGCLNDWNCSNCCGKYHNNIWSFYCTLCDYHLCLYCCGYK